MPPKSNRRGAANSRRSPHGASRPPREQKHVPYGIGDLRRSAAASMFGPGAVADFRTDKGAAVSVVAAGLDEWVRNWPRLEMVHDPRLEHVLGVEGFRLPPVVRDEEEDGARAIPGVRFPRWLQCPQCDTIRIATRWSCEPANPARWCPECTGARGPRQRVYVVPVRFVRACESGHLDDFPWEHWVEHESGCPSRDKLKLLSVGAGLSGVRVFCLTCKASRGMGQAFSIEFSCTGRRPWLAQAPETCTRKLRVVQRGASNLYFPITRSSLLIPPWDDRIEQRLGDHWTDLLDADAEERPDLLRRWLERGRIDIPSDWNRGAFIKDVLARVVQHEGIVVTDLKAEEWTRFTNPAATGDVSDSEFEYRPEPLPEQLRSHFSIVGRVVRLRELRALIGFTRINPPPSMDDVDRQQIASLSVDRKNWYPAVEVRGEGIFIAFDQGRVDQWSSMAVVRDRVRRIDVGFQKEFSDRMPGTEGPTRRITPAFTLAHTFGHALMRELALECGYSSAALRERVYSGEYGTGVLIYTATTDADGTLGGLQRQGRARLIEGVVKSAIQSMRWCSSDPLCVSGSMMVSNETNLAACHACLLAAETSCEDFNRLLDRALLTGTPDDPAVGYFRDWVH